MNAIAHPLPTGTARFIVEAKSIQRRRLAAGVRHPLLGHAMRQLLRCPALLRDDQMIPAVGDAYRTVFLWSDAGCDLSLVALVWSFGQRTPIHDHHAACVIGVYRGAEREVCYARTAPGADTVVPIGESVLRPGSVSVVPPGEREIHRVEAAAPPPEVTVSLHFYETDVTQRPGHTSIKQRFREAAGALLGEAHALPVT